MTLDELKGGLSSHLHHLVLVNADGKTVLLDGDFTAEDLFLIYTYLNTPIENR